MTILVRHISNFIKISSWRKFLNSLFLFRFLSSQEKRAINGEAVEAVQRELGSFPHYSIYPKLFIFKY